MSADGGDTWRPAGTRIELPMASALHRARALARHDPDPAAATTPVFDRLEHGSGTVLP